MALYCHKCGYRMDDEDVFCSNCGAKAKRPQAMQAEKSEVQLNHKQTSETKPSESLSAVENSAQVPSDTAESEIIAPDEIIVSEESINIMETSNAKDAGPQEEAVSEKAVRLESEPEVNAEQKEEKNTPAEELIFEFRPKEFVTDEEPSAQSVLFRSMPDLVFADASEKHDKKKKSGSGAVRAVCSVFLSLFVFVFSVALILQLFVRFAFTEDRLRSAFNNVNYKEIKAGSILNLKTISEKYGKDIPEDATLAEAIYSMIDQRELVNPISLNEVEILIDRLDFQEFLAEKSSKAVEILRSGSRGQQPVYASEIISFLKDHEEEIEKTIGIKILGVDYKYMQKYLEDHNDELLDLLSEKSMTGAEDAFGYELIRFFCSDWFIAVLGAMIILIAAAVGFINQRVSFSLLYTGMPIAIAGIVLVVCSVFYQYLFYKLSFYFPTEFIEQFAAPIIGVLTVSGAVSSAAGALMIIIGFMLKSKEKRKKNREINNVVEKSWIL